MRSVIPQAFLDSPHTDVRLASRGWIRVQALIWWSQSGSNRRPPACKAGALPAELWPHDRSRASQNPLVGLGGLEPPASPLSGVRSNHLSYRPRRDQVVECRVLVRTPVNWTDRCSKGGDPAAPSDTATLLRLHPSHRPYHRRLPPLRVGAPTSGTVNSHGVTGGVYKARERIHRGMLIRDY